MDMVRLNLEDSHCIDEYVVCWRQENYACSLQEFLGMTEEEFKLWKENPNLFHHIVYIG